MFKLANYFYQLIFRQPMGENARRFLQNSFWSMGGGLLAFAFLFLANILAGRWLGPEEYGKYNLILALANILAILLVLDSDVGITYFVSRAKEIKTRKKEITNSLGLAFLIYVTVIFFGLAIYKLIDYFYSFSHPPLFWVWFLATIIAGKRISEAIIRGLKKFRYQALVKIGEGIIVLSLLIIIIFIWRKVVYQSYLIALVTGGLVLLTIYFLKIKKYIQSNLLQWSHLKKIFHYSRWGIINSLTTIGFKGFDKLIVAGLLGAYQLGIYSAYYTISILLSARLIQLLVNVYFPSINEIKNKKELINKVNRFILKLSLPILFAYILGARLLLFLFGKEYPLHWTWLFILGFYFLFHLSANLYGWILASHSKEGYRYQNWGGLLSLFVFAFVIFIIWRLNLFSISSLFLTLTLSKFALLVFYRVEISSLVKKS